MFDEIFHCVLSEIVFSIVIVSKTIRLLFPALTNYVLLFVFDKINCKYSVQKYAFEFEKLQFNIDIF